MTLHAIISGWGSAGDMIPLLAVGAALRRRGHDVDFIGNPHFERTAVDAGLTFRAVGRVVDHAALMADDTVFGGRRRSWAQIYADHYVPHLQTFHDTTAAALRPDTLAIIGDEVGAATVAELRGIPRVRVAPSPPRFASRDHLPHPEGLLPPWFAFCARSGTGMALLYRARALRRGRFRWPLRAAQLPEDHPITRFRSQLGLPPAPASNADAILCMWPEWFAPPQRDWPRGAVIAGFPMYPPPVPAVPPAPGGRRPIVATTGTVAGAQTRFFQRVVDTCRILDRPAVLVSPHADHIPHPLPPDVRYAAHAPFNELFSQASLVIHHGGIGTSSYALAAGIPQVVVPMRGDQFDNGNRLVRLGVARMVSAERTGSRELADIVEGLLTSTMTQRRCRLWQSRLDPEEGLRRAVAYIEALRRPAEWPALSRS